MPLGWIDPEVALVHRGVPIYHTYKDDDIENRMEYWYSFYVASETEAFDVRNLVADGRDGDVTKEDERQKIIRLAIEQGALAVPDDCKPDCPHENLCVDEYAVSGAAACATLDRDAHTGQVIGFQVNRLDGEMKEVHFYCEDCGESFKWGEVQNF